MPESLEVTAVVRGRRSIGPRTVLLELGVDPPESRFPFHPGQWVLVTVPMPDGEDGQRAFSIASAPGDASIEICVESRGEAKEEGARGTGGEVPEGAGSEGAGEAGEKRGRKPSISWVLAGLETGARVRLGGPHGKFILGAAAFEERLVLAGAGVGVVPLRSILRHLDRTGDWTSPTVLYLEAPEAEGILFRDELEALAARRENFTFHPLVLAEVREDTVERGELLLRAIREELKSPDAVRVMLAGFNADVNAACEHIQKARLSPDRFLVERYG